MAEAKEKAIELFKKYYCLENNSKKRIRVIEFDAAKQCAKIAVEEILKELPMTELHHLGGYTLNNPRIEFYNQVFKEIELI